MNNVVDKSEIARLLAIAVNRNPPTLQEGCNEEGDDSRILACGVLPRSEDVEIAKTHGLESIGPTEYLAVLFAGQFGDSIGRNGAGSDAFVFGKFRILAVDRRRRRVHDAPNVVLTSGIEEGQRPFDVDLVCCDGIPDRSGNRGERPLVEDDFDIASCLVHDVVTSKISFDQVDAVGKRAQVGPLTGREVIEDANRVPVLQKRPHQIGSDKSCAAGYETVHRCSCPVGWGILTVTTVLGT